MSSADNLATTTTAPRLRLGEMLAAAGKISVHDLERALLAQQEVGDLLGRVLVRLGVIAENDLVQALAEQLQLPLVNNAEFPLEAIWLEGVQLDFLINNSILPLQQDKDILHVAMSVPQDSFALKALQLATGLTIKPSLGVESELVTAIRRLYIDVAEEEREGESSDHSLSGEEFIEHLRDIASEAPVIRQVNQIITNALDRRASDVHIEPSENSVNVRYRIDGVLQDAETLPLAQSAAIASRIKLLAKLNIAERRLPQDGRIKMRIKGHELDLRVSTVPTVFGESIVMRLLDRETIHFSLEDMGFSRDILEDFNELLARPHGILLLTGPTGSGKTTTLYAALTKLDATALKILTVEDPVEYQLPLINQIQVQPKIGLTFAYALRSILRQDPDIIMIGEMRDTETAQIAVQSALTGHLVLSTLHTNTAAAAIIRLEDMGIERYLLTSTVNGVLSQRLLRRLCTHCREAIDLSPELVKESGLSHFLQNDSRQVYQARGCEKCKHTGYLGRTAIHELFIMDDRMRAAINSGADATSLHAAARQAGMMTLYEDGLRKVAAGTTSLDELLRVTQDQSDAGV
ncbi:MAG: type II secretion system ATPase GspE [Thiohalomonadaceae bacterium]